MITTQTKVVILTITVGSLAVVGVAQGQTCNSPQDTFRVGRFDRASGTFCDNNLANTESCYGAVAKVPFQIDLPEDGTASVECQTFDADENPFSDAGLCIMDANCNQLLAQGRQRVRYQGPITGSTLKLIVADPNNQGICAGGFLVECAIQDPSLVLKKNFENGDTCDWLKRKVAGLFRPPCEASPAGELTVGASELRPKTGYYSHRRGVHRAALRGLDPAGVQLRLFWWDGSEWVLVTASEPERGDLAEFEGLAGYYRWEVVSHGAAGSYDLEFEYPGVRRTKQVANTLEVVRAGAKGGAYSLKSVYTGSPIKQFLIEDRTVSELRNRINATKITLKFWMRAGGDLEVAGKPVILRIAQLQPRFKDMMAVFVEPLGTGRIMVALRVLKQRFEGDQRGQWLRVGGRNGGVPLEIGRNYREFTIEWHASSAEGVGCASIKRGGGVSQNILCDPRMPYNVSRVLLGQVANHGQTRGTIYFDDLEMRTDAKELCPGGVCR